MKNYQASRGATLVALAFLVTLVVLPACKSLGADPVLHKFQLWGTMDRVDKLNFYLGWTNGFLAARGQRGLDLANCLETLDNEQAIAMIDKQYKEHPERWSRPIGDQILQALTIEGGPCEGKNPLQTDSK